MQVKDPVVHDSSGLWKHKKTQHALYNILGLGSATLLQLAFIGESDPNFPWEKISQWDNKVYKIQIQNNTQEEDRHTD